MIEIIEVDQCYLVFDIFKVFHVICTEYALVLKLCTQLI
jgi:hypothetical protein